MLNLGKVTLGAIWKVVQDVNQFQDLKLPYGRPEASFSKKCLKIILIDLKIFCISIHKTSHRTLQLYLRIIICHTGQSIGQFLEIWVNQS